MGCLGHIYQPDSMAGSELGNRYAFERIDRLKIPRRKLLVLYISLGLLFAFIFSTMTGAASRFINLGGGEASLKMLTGVALLT